MKTRLRKITINRVDLVDQGANPDAHICLAKSVDPVDGLGMALDRVVKVGRAISSARAKKLLEMFKELRILLRDAGLTDEELDMADDTELEKRVERMELEKQELASKLEKSETALKVAEDALEKAQSSADEIQKRVADLEAANKESVDKLEKMHAAAELRDAVDFIKTTFPNVGEPEKKARLWKGLSAEDRATYEGDLKVMDKKLETAFSQLGSTGSGDTDVRKRVDVLAQELQKADSSLTTHQARAKVWKQHPELRAELNKEGR